MSPTTASASSAVPALITTSLIVVSILFLVLSLAAVILRYGARKAARQPIQSDDYWIVISWIFALSLSTDVWVFGSLTGINHYKIDLLKGTEDSLKCLFVAAILSLPPLTAVKISVMLFYKRVFPTPKFKIAVGVAIPLILAWGAIFCALFATHIDPISATWKPGQGHYRWGVTSTPLAQVISSVVLDVIVLMFPVPIIYGLHMRTQRKIAVTLIFWLGGFCCIAGIVRAVLIKQTLSTLGGSENVVYIETKQFMFAIIEPNCSIIAACLPCYGPLFTKGRPQESLLRSFRSVFSLRSKTSSAYHDKYALHNAAPRTGTSFESHLELKQASRDWAMSQSQGHYASNVESHLPEEVGDYHADEISVARSYDVSRV